MFCALHDQLASLGGHVQLTRCFSAVAELLFVLLLTVHNIVYRLLVRIQTPVENEMYGCHSKQVPRLLKIAKEMDLDVVGVR